MPNTIRLHRVLRASPDRVYRAFLDPDAMVKSGAMQVTVALKRVPCGTELEITQEGVPDVIPTEACYLGWQESLVLLAKLVEAEIPDGA